MIIRFSVENWMSFKEKATFSMIGSKERQHSERVPKILKYNAKVLPICAIYGGNASGKTNFFKALNFVKLTVVKGTVAERLIPVIPFLLEPGYADKPSSFSIEILINETIYEFSFTLTRKKIVEEKLVKINSTSEKTLYHRKEGNETFSSDIEKYKKDNYLAFAYKGTKSTRLFLTNTVSQQIDTFRHIYDWFNDRLELIAPDSSFGNIDRFIDEKDPLSSDMKDILPLLDTGIIRLSDKDIPFDSLQLSEALKNDLQAEINEDKVFLLTSSTNPHERVLIKAKDGDLVAKKLITIHLNSERKEVRFDMQQESDGSKRVVDLLPAFLELSKSKSDKVFVVDELDRSLHTLLSRQLINQHLLSCSNDTRSQLLFTTHDVLLMDQKFLRRDEMWVTERDSDGSSKIYSFSEFKGIRYDKDVRTSYLLGRMGGVPNVMLNSSCSKS